MVRPKRKFKTNNFNVIFANLMHIKSLLHSKNMWVQYPANLKMTQSNHGSNMLLLTHLLVTPRSIICDPEFRVKVKSEMTVHEKRGKYTRVYL